MDVKRFQQIIVVLEDIRILDHFELVVVLVHKLVTFPIIFRRVVAN